MYLQQLNMQLLASSTLYGTQGYPGPKQPTVADVYLVLFESASELHQVSRYLISQGYQNARLWTSSNALSSDHFVSLTTGMRLPYPKWAPGHPDNAGGNESCVYWAYVTDLSK